MSCSVENISTAEDLIEALLRTAFSLSGAFAALLEDWSGEAFPGEDPAAVLVEMMAGSSLPAVASAGEANCRAATALIEAVRERVLDDLRTAAQLSRQDGEVLL